MTSEIRGVSRFSRFSINGKAMAISKALSVSVFNQVVSSGTNFALGIYLVRVLPPEAFGLYGIGFAISLFYAGIGNALFLTQMVVHSPDKAPDDRLPYAGRILSLVVLFCALSGFFAGIVLFVGSIFWEPVAHYAEFSGAVIAASIGYLLKDFFVRHSYNMRRETWALTINSTIACTMGVLLWVQYVVVETFNVELAIWIYALAQLGGVVAGAFFAKLPISVRQQCGLRGDLKEVWHGGKWASITNLVYFIRTQAHTIVVATLLGPVGVANLNAARLLVTPAVMLTPALSQVAMPRLASVRAQGDAQVVKYGFVVTLVLLAVALIYCSILLGGYEFIVIRLLGDKYQDVFSIVLLWCVYTCLLALRNGAELSSQVLRKFKNLSTANSLSALVSIFAVYGLTVAIGLQGALLGLAVAEFLLIVWLCRMMLMAFRDEKHF